MLTISGSSWAKRHRRDFSAVLSIEDPGTRHGLRFHKTPHPDHLILRFVDLDRPPPAPYNELPIFRMASMQDIEDGLAFARNCDNLLVHCQVGISRSPAFVLGILMERLGSEDAAFAELAKIRPEAVPNKHVINLIDQLLGSNLSASLDKWDARSTWSALRRMLCRRAYFLAGGISLEPDVAAISLTDLLKWASIQ